VVVQTIERYHRGRPLEIVSGVQAGEATKRS